MDAFATASHVQELSSQGGQLPPAFEQRDILLTELARQLAADDAVALRALGLGRREVDRDRTQWREQQAERRAGRERPRG